MDPSATKVGPIHIMQSVKVNRRTFGAWFVRTALVTIALAGVVLTVQINDKGLASLSSFGFLLRMTELGLLGLMGCVAMGLAQVAFEKQGGARREIFEDIALFACLEGTIF